MKKLFLIAIVPCLFACNASKKAGGTNGPVQSTKIWDVAPHSAFTTLIRYNEAFYCSFREGTGHKPPGTDGKVRVIKSTDGKKWESIALLEKATIDLRDPMLSVTPDNRIMLSIGGSVYDPQERSKLIDMNPMVSFMDASGNFSEPEKVTVISPNARNWIWRVTWHKGVAYGMSYSTNTLTLMKSTDGKRFEKVIQLDVDGQPNESTVRFDEHDQMYVLIRREQLDKMGILAKSVPPYTNWTYKKIAMRVGGPNFIFSADGKHLIIGSRLYEETGPLTGIVVADLEGNILKTIKLPSKGDTSYPGLVLYDGKLWVTYYSSHEAKTSIYLTTIPVKQLKP